MADRLLVIGGDAAGMTAATAARRARPDLEIVVVEQGRYTSYSACGIPYLFGGHIEDVDDLVVRTPQEFRDAHRIDVRTRHRVTAIDLDARRVEVRALDQQRTFHLAFDQLHIATGAKPVRPPLPGIDAPWVHGVQNLADATRLLDALEPPVQRVVVVGGGYIGLEMAEAFIDRGDRVTLVDSAPVPLGAVDPDMGGRLAKVLERYGVDVRCGVEVTGFADQVVQTSDGEIPADIAVLGLGVGPAADLAVDAGLDTGVAGAIAVDHRQRTSAAGVYAAGDCADTFHLVSRGRTYVALGTVANKTGRVAGVNIGGGYASFPGVLGTAITRICAVEVARTGLNEAEAAEAGIEHVTATIEATSRAGYLPSAEPVTARVLAERGSGRIIGAQILGADRVGKRIDTMATAITAGMSADQIVELDLGYAPAVTPLWDPFQVAARAADRELRTGQA